MLPWRSAVLAPLCALALIFAACGGGSPPGNPDGGVSCTHNFDCPSGQGCVKGACAPQPCGGCQPDQVCSDNGRCIAAQGAACPSGGCPSGYNCNGTVCTKPCTLDNECGPGFVCNSALRACAQCTFDSQCTGVTGKPRCDSASGTCVACTQPIDCSSGNFCNTTTHTCVKGCHADGDCNLTLGEHCDGGNASTLGQCVQCSKATQKTDCPEPNASVCDNTGHCVACVDDSSCPANGARRCDVATKTCVTCLGASNATGTDCGLPDFNGGPHDPHQERTCSAAHSCVAGCQFDTQCGCPRKADGTQDTLNCKRVPHVECFTDSQCNLAAGDKCIGAGSTTPGHCMRPDSSPATTRSRAVVSGEYCDAKLTVDSDNVASIGACVECLVGHNEHCRYRIRGVAPTPANYNGAFNGPDVGQNGSRCVNDFCAEGCDSNDDCPANKTCHLSSDINDKLRNTCVECSCAGATTQDNNSWCLDSARCLDSGGPRVCDVKTLNCRHKRFNETCAKSNECGDSKDPATNTAGSSTCVPVPGICVKLYQPTTGDPVSTQCKGLPSGRCGIPCQDFNLNLCDASSAATGVCPFKSTCRGVDDSAGNHGKYCVPQACR